MTQMMCFSSTSYEEDIRHLISGDVKLDYLIMMVPLASKCSHSVILSSLLAGDKQSSSSTLPGGGNREKGLPDPPHIAASRWKAGAQSGRLESGTQDISGQQPFF